jgi:hypothetical protein
MTKFVKIIVSSKDGLEMHANPALIEKKKKKDAILPHQSSLLLHTNIFRFVINFILEMISDNSFTYSSVILTTQYQRFHNQLQVTYN